ncbi:hypothetical protein Syun_019573 [Stephania yunnanensis]|uniref:Uncharacterized protein n=1 Tax=Stephania yunnanensis TaxID=152371 RepID=A0AAP0IUD1_9MAGN
MLPPSKTLPYLQVFVSLSIRTSEGMGFIISFRLANVKAALTPLQFHTIIFVSIGTLGPGCVRLPPPPFTLSSPSLYPCSALNSPFLRLPFFTKVK